MDADLLAIVMSPPVRHFCEAKREGVDRHAERESKRERVRVRANR